jgi:HSP20 family molecular chaperone IbpA
VRSRRVFLIIIFTIFNLNSSFAQNNGQPDIDKATEQLLKEYQREIEEMMKSPTFKGLGRMFEQMMQDMDQDIAKDLENFFQNGQFDTLLRSSDIFGQMQIGQGEWIETPKERILVLKFKSTENSPLDIKVENGKITIKGQIVVETKEQFAGGGESISRSVRSINQEYMVPEDVDAGSVNFENKDGEILMKFTKKAFASKLEKSKEKPSRPKDERRPLVPKKGDVTI